MKVDFKAKQLEFTDYIRDPVNNLPPADVKADRIKTYRELLFNNIEGFLSSNFPVIKTLLNEQQWFELTQDFFANHPCTSPYFSEIPEEFINYLQNERQNSADFPFLLELAHYEWVEMALSIAQDESTINSNDFIKNLKQQQIAVSKLAWPLVYQYPVHKISPSFLPEKPPLEPTYLLVYRDNLDEVNFMHMPLITFRLLQVLEQSKTLSCIKCLEQIAEESGHPEPDQIIKSGLEILVGLAEKGIIIPNH